ncbi:hypothetical protein E5Q_05952 [Mixia osmundae IAM 14324]|uniref:phosphoethanolamine N-methyltransferase n=1 Tax=Mixia osmundae (strain CBS 9802 / IAM 14324 / JCM 22182 / KY 12970) TaxID=764103 RepID=G7E9D9_MIXOS|nr:hypothetical protein E5Q_05952 [Mixia osmundae IAM 14324]
MIEGAVALLLGLLAPSLVRYLVSRFRSSYGHEAYGDALQHAALNIRCDSLWLNMGFWAKTVDFPTACQDLALQLVQHARLDATLPRGQSSVLELGCGCGETFRVWQATFRPDVIDAVTTMRSHAVIAEQRLRDLTDANLLRDHHLYQRDAIEYTRNPDRRYDAVIALDCAYHFDTRAAFLRNAYGCLQTGGTLALTDIVMLQPISKLGAFDRLKQWAVCRLAGVPWTNMVTDMEEYVTLLQGIGYNNINIRDISSDVFEPLAAFLEERAGDANFGVVSRTIWWEYLAFASVLRWWHRGRQVGFVLIAAQKP